MCTFYSLFFPDGRADHAIAMRPSKTLYDALALDATATSEQLKYRADALLLKLRNEVATPSDDHDNQLKIIAYAREVLTDPIKRARYDQAMRTKLEEATTDPVIVIRERSSMGVWLALSLLTIAALVGYLILSKRKTDAPPANAAAVVTRTLPSKESLTVPIENTTPTAATIAADPATSAAKSDLSPIEIFQTNRNSIVVVRSASEAGGRSSQGSGVVIADEEVVTNCHVAISSSDIIVRTETQSLPAKLRYRDQGHDLCQLTVRGLKAKPVTRAAVATVAVGAKVYAIGAPQGLELTLSDGVVSSLRNLGGTSLIQTNAAISPGSSGGGLFDSSGRLIGITTFQSRTGQNLNFAVPTDWIDALPARDGNSDTLLPDSTASSGVPDAFRPRSGNGGNGGNGGSGSAANAETENRRRLLVGTWSCHAGSTPGRQAQYEFASDGTLILKIRKDNSNWDTSAIQYRLVSENSLILYSPGAQPQQIAIKLAEVSGTHAVIEWEGGRKFNHYCSRGGV